MVCYLSVLDVLEVMSLGVDRIIVHQWIAIVKETNCITENLNETESLSAAAVVGGVDVGA
jgi:hypothetical protein